METRHGKVAIVMALTLFLSMIIVYLPKATTADPGTINVPGDYLTIQDAIDHAVSGDTILVQDGTYDGALYVLGKSLTIEAATGTPIIRGGQLFTTNYNGAAFSRRAAIFVVNSTNVVIEGFDIEGQGLNVSGMTADVVYVYSGGEINDCIISPNTVHLVAYGLGIECRGCPYISIQNCVVEKFGRIGMYFVNCTGRVNGNKIIGQVYSGEGEVNYGIEVESHQGACNLEIFNNEIYNSDNTFLPYPSWSSAAIIVDINRQFYDVTGSTVAIVGNNIHSNYMAIEAVSNPLLYAHYNNIYDNLYGVWVDPDLYGLYEQLDAQYNWWGDPTGPNPPGLGDNYDPGNVTATGFLSGPYASRLYIDPPEVFKGPGDVDSFFDVYINLENFANLAGFDIKLTWDNSLITENSIDYTTYLNALWGTNPDAWSVVYEQHGAGYCEIAAVALAGSSSNTGTSTLFKLTFKVMKSSNFELATPISFTVVKLSDNAIPTPNPIVVGTTTDGRYTISGMKPDIEVAIVGQYHDPPFEFCDTFTLEVYVSDISANSPLTGYDLTIQYGTHLARFQTVAEWGPVCNPGTYSETTPGEITIEASGIGWSGTSGLLFKLTFHVEFANIEEHVWKKGNANYETFAISVADATLSFTSGTISSAEITMPSPMTVQVNFIRGDVNCDGRVTIIDLSDAAYYYDKTSADPDWATVRRYDLNNDNTIDIFDLVAIATNYGYGLPHH